MTQYLRVVDVFQKFQNFEIFTKMDPFIPARSTHWLDFYFSYCILSISVAVVLLWYLRSYNGFELAHYEKINYFRN